MTKAEVLQKVNDYCTEKQYTTSTLSDAFRDKFADHFQKANPDADINDENIVASLKFNLNVAFSSASDLAAAKATEFATKENDFKHQIEELKKKIPTKVDPEPNKIPKEVQDQLDELKAFKDEKSRQEKLTNILGLAKQGIRQDLHKSFDNYAKDYTVKLDKEDKEQADELVSRFGAIFKDSIGDIKPLAPQVDKERDQKVLESIPKIKI